MFKRRLQISAEGVHNESAFLALVRSSLCSWSIRAARNSFKHCGFSVVTVEEEETAERKDEGEVVVIFSLTHTHFTKIQKRSFWGKSSHFDDARSECATMLLNTCHPTRHDTHAGCLIPEHFTYTSLVCPTPERGKKSDPAERKQNVTRSSGLLARNSLIV